MSVQNPERVVTKQDLADFYEQILPYLGGMPEILANKFSKGDMYSTDERMIGQWIDGKPLYQKVLNVSISIQAQTWYEASSIDTSGIETFVKCIGFLTSNNHVFNIDDCQCVDNHMWFYNSCQATCDKLLIQYTKTADSPISIGNDTDYRTDEKIIGTWIDGSPIYQRTFTGLNCTLHHENWAILCNIPSVGIVLRIDALYNNVGAAAGYNTVQIKEFEPNSNGNISVIGITSGRTITRATIQYTKTS